MIRAFRTPSAHGAAAALLVLLVANALFTPGFVSLATMGNVALQVSTTVIVALGMTLVIATGGIDLSVGAVMAVSSVIGATFLDRGAPVATALAMLAALAVGIGNGVLVAYQQVPPIIVTLAGLIMGRGVAQVLVEGNPLVAFSHPSFERLGKGSVGPVPVPVLVALVLLGIAVALMRHTTFGRWVLATGGNPRAAHLAGVPVSAVKLVTYAASGGLAGLAGLIETARLAAADAGKIGQAMELDAIVAVVVGGTALSGGRANLTGTVIGAVLMGVLTTSFNMHLLSPAWAQMVKAIILVAAVWTQRTKAA